MSSGVPQFSPQQRLLSTGDAAGNLRQVSTDQVSLAAGSSATSRWPGLHQPQVAAPQLAAPGMANLCQQMPLGFGNPASSPGMQGPFKFHVNASPVTSPNEHQRSEITPSESTDATPGPLPQMPLLTPSTPVFSSPAHQSASVAGADRTAHRSKLCKQAFQFVDALQTGHIDISQNKTGLTMVFDQLADVPMPKDEWYARVFRNFVGNESDLIDYRGFKEIVRQWDEHHQKKRQQYHQQQQPLHHQPEQQSHLSVQQLEKQKSSSVDVPLPLPLEEKALTAVFSNRPSPAVSLDTGCIALPEDSVNERDSGAVQPPVRLQATSPSSNHACAQTRRASVTGKALGEASDERRDGREAAAMIASEVMFPTYVGRLAIFDDYEFFGDVGSGSFGKVMVVRHRNTKQLRACKVVAVQTALQRELMDTEIKLLKSLNHPNIMKMHEVYFEQARKQGQITNGNIYLVTELCEGGDLFSRILHHYDRLKKPMTESHVAYMMQQILSATQFCHGNGIIHRDIKPENILFVDRSSNSALKIIDFGLANFHEKIREQAKEVKVARSGAIGRLARLLPAVNGRHLIPWHERKKVMQKAGTPHYMAPEMIEGSYDEKVDLFSIGIILCQLFTGWHPFYTPGDDETSVRAKISQPEPVQFPTDIWQTVSEEARDLCRKLLEKSAKKRLSAKQALEHPWFKDPSKPSPFGNIQGLSHSIFDGLMQYQAYNKLKRAVLQLLTRELSEFQIQELRAKFMALDTQGDGLLSPEELVEGMRNIGYEMTQNELGQIMAALDGSGSQRIGYKEFISALIERRVKFDRQQLFECFKKFDKQGIGRITYQDIQSVMCNAVTESEWQEIAGFTADAGNMPELSFDEFVTLMDQTET
eukprot:TRINITY_DN2327_c0_g2_i1.p1 TRINITY_DN2327_c0_g2~~TRINITY_DN2327_c0_g2_i1.p1  ORF type:complete len:944 (-),score=170.29 TRINITY_DN2327_c0_g2_i1:258-2876(-)